MTGESSSLESTEERASRQARTNSEEMAPSASPDPGESRGRYCPISDYAVIGNCRTAALVSRTGSIDWLCLPRFDGPWLFGGLLDHTRGGRFAVRPRLNGSTNDGVGFGVTRRYLEGTPVLETTFRTGDGVVRLVDFMPVTVDSDEHLEPRGEHQVLRRLECVEGTASLRVIFEPRPESGRRRPAIESRGRLGFWCEHGRGAVTLGVEPPFTEETDGRRVHGTIEMERGDVRWLSLCYERDEIPVLPPLGEVAELRLEETLSWWRDWSSRCTYDGPFEAEVVRSAITLKLLTYAPSGAIVAAVTSSLPESIGGARNWDYRYCWLRDASLTFRALFDLGYITEARAFFGWIMHSTRLTRPEVRAVYDVLGRHVRREETLSHLEGYRGSHPVRIGNDARDQLQLDIYGEVILAAYEFVNRGGKLDAGERRRLADLGERVCERWDEPDEGIWEMRGGRRHHTYSKAMCWVALDRLLNFPEEWPLHIPRRRFEEIRDRIRDTIELWGWNEEVGSYVADFASARPDAALLRLATTGFEDPCSERMRSTRHWLIEKLEDNGLLYRYDSDHDVHESREGAFGLCGFWDVQLCALQGDLFEATERFRHLLGFANDVGIYSEEIDPSTGAALGNVPQSFTHLGLISAALDIERARRDEG